LAERVPELRDVFLLGPLDLLFEGPEAGAELGRPLVERLKDNEATAPPDQHLRLIIREATVFGEADRLAAAVLEELGSRAHGMKKYRRLYIFDSRPRGPDGSGAQTTEALSA
jgi:hypothetical protein